MRLCPNKAIALRYSGYTSNNGIYPRKYRIFLTVGIPSLNIMRSHSKMKPDNIVGNRELLIWDIPLPF